MLDNILSSITIDKQGVEIGGPSRTGTILYHHAKNIDNIVLISYC